MIGRGTNLGKGWWRFSGDVQSVKCMVPQSNAMPDEGHMLSLCHDRPQVGLMSRQGCGDEERRYQGRQGWLGPQRSNLVRSFGKGGGKGKEL